LPPKSQASINEPPLSNDALAMRNPVEPKTRQASAENPSSFAHAPDYSWLTGELWYVPGKNLWKVHYGSGKESDRYGGIMTLSDAGPMSEYRIGQMVYVEGSLADPGNQSSHAIYRVNRILELVNSDSKEVEAAGIERASARQESGD
jgi:hypothetical protein